MKMSQRIKERRLAMKYTQEELGKKLGIGKSAVAKYENGRVENIKRSTISEMAKVLECSPCYLMGWDSEEKEQNFKLSAFEKDIVWKIRLLNVEGVSKLIGYADDLISSGKYEKGVTAAKMA